MVFVLRVDRSIKDGEFSEMLSHNVRTLQRLLTQLNERNLFSDLSIQQLIRSQQHAVSNFLHRWYHAKSKRYSTT